MKYTFGQWFGIIWGCLGLINFGYASSGGDDLTIGLSFILNGMFFGIPSILLYYVCKKK